MDRALGKPHTLWVAFAKFYERHGDIANARVIFEKAIQQPYKYVDDLATVSREAVLLRILCLHQAFHMGMSDMRQP
jgi:pre-mRNA-splicing factor SYF1